MSVLKANRHLSKTEFEQSYSVFFADSERILNKCPKRRVKYIAEPISVLNVLLYQEIMNITSDLYSKSKWKKEQKQKHIQNSFKYIERLNRAIMVYANIREMDFEEQCRWCEPIPNILEYLNKEVELPYENSKYTFRVLDWDKIKDFELLNNMCELHRYCHGKAVRAKEFLDNGTTSLFIKIIDDAFYLTMIANSYIPRTKEEYEERKEMIDYALKELYHIQRPMLTFFNFMHYSNNVQTEWGDMLKLQIKLLKGLQKSDEKRFSKLP